MMFDAPRDMKAMEDKNSFYFVCPLDKPSWSQFRGEKVYVITTVSKLLPLGFHLQWQNAALNIFVEHQHEGCKLASVKEI